jgi:hypothetical protein
LFVGLKSKKKKMRYFQVCLKENEKYVIASQSTNVVRLRRGFAGRIV